MQHDDLIWSVIDKHHCAYRMTSTSKIEKLCRNEYNVDGICCRKSCPLANSQYATVREHEGKLYLYMKVVERAAFPDRLWERVRLSNKYKESLLLISRHMAYWDHWQLRKVKLRYTRMKQVMVRKRKLAKKEPEVHLEELSSKHERREKKREYKALIAARMEKTVEEELKARLKKGVYGDIYNFNQKVFTKVAEDQDDDELQLEDDDEEFMSEEEEFDELQKSELVIDNTISESEPEMEDFIPLEENSKDKKGTKSKKKRRKLEIEYETETPKRNRAKLAVKS